MSGMAEIVGAAAGVELRVGDMSPDALASALRGPRVPNLRVPRRIPVAFNADGLAAFPVIPGARMWDLRAAILWWRSPIFGNSPPDWADISNGGVSDIVAVMCLGQNLPPKGQNAGTWDSSTEYITVPGEIENINARVTFARGQVVGKPGERFYVLTDKTMTGGDGISGMTIAFEDYDADYYLGGGVNSL